MRKDEETGEKLIDLWFPQPERIKLFGVDKPVYAYRLSKGTDKERVVLSNKRLSKKKPENYYRSRWQIESEIRVLKSLGLESYMVRKLKAIRLWIMAVWHVALIRLRSILDGIDFTRLLALLEFVEFMKPLIRRCLRFSPFPDDKLVLFLLRNLIGGDSCCAKV